MIAPDRRMSTTFSRLTASFSHCVAPAARNTAGRHRTNPSGVHAPAAGNTAQRPARRARRRHPTCNRYSARPAAPGMRRATATAAPRFACNHAVHAALPGAEPHATESRKALLRQLESAIPPATNQPSRSSSLAYPTSSATNPRGSWAEQAIARNPSHRA